MNILGMHASGPNTSACLLKDGEVIAFAEEERFTRVKLASGAIPTRAAGYCLKEGGLDLSQVDAITLGWANNKYPHEMAKFYAEHMEHPAKDDYSRIYEQVSLAEKDPKFFGRRVEMAFRRTGYHGAFPKLVYHRHHLSHAYSVYYPSPFDEAIVVVIDGSGEEMATSLWHAQNNTVKFLYSYDLPNSLGYFYAALTEYLGFSVFTGEGKVMGLAPYGKPNPDLARRLDSVLQLDGDGYRVDPEFIYFAPRTFSFRHTDKLVELLGRPPRKPEAEILDWHVELAWETQNKLEQAVQHIVRAAVKRTNVRNICIAGGVAMNCKMNGVVAAMDEVDACFVIPASTDAGVALGSALIQSRDVPNLREKVRRLSVYSGPAYGDAAIEAALKEAKINNYRRLPDAELFDYVAERLALGAIVGWFQGRMEVGSRALGNRSILADPARPDMKDKINREVKHREGFRPFAPSILAEHAHEFFAARPQGAHQLYHSWMLQAAQVLDGAKQRFPAVVHVDNSIRPQVVSRESNERYYRLIQAFFRRTGLPALVNTSFNVRGEPIICRPEEAIRCFFSTGLDVLAMGNVVLEK